MTFRRNLLSVLSSEARSISSLARELRVTPAEIEADLRHVIRTARAAGDQIVVLPARCRTCGLVFGEQKLTKPGKCPACRGSRIFEPQIRIARGTHDTRRE